MGFLDGLAVGGFHDGAVEDLGGVQGGKVGGGVFQQGDARTGGQTTTSGSGYYMVVWPPGGILAGR